MSGRAAFLAGMAAAALLTVGAPRLVSAADPYREVSLSLGQTLVALFPAAEGYVISAAGGEAFVDLARKDLLREGMELQVYRPGDDMVHPVTKQVLGSYEKNLGVLRVTEVREKYSRGQLDAAGAAASIVGGDRVRITSRRLRTLLSITGVAPGVEVGPLAQALLARGEESGRFAMIDEPAWEASLAALGAPWDDVRADPAALRRLGELTAADLLLLVRIAPGTTPRVVVEVRSLSTGEAQGTFSERWPVPAAASPAAIAPPVAAPVAFAPVADDAPPVPAVAQEGTSVPGAPGSIAAEPAQGPSEYTVRELSSPARSLAAGNILGEGRLELVLSDGAKLSLYRWEEDSLSWRWDEDGRRGRRVLSLDAGDFDGDGRVEVLVALVVQGRVRTELRRWRDGALQVEGAVEGVYLRSSPRPGQPPLLLGQRAGVAEILTGRVEHYRLDGSSLERIEDSGLPRGVGIFGLALAPTGGTVALYALDRSGFLSGLSPEGATLWRSSRQYGGYPPPLAARELFGPTSADDEGFDEQARVFQGRLAAEPAPGGIRLLVPRNYTDSGVVLVRQRASGKGEVVVLEGPGEFPEEATRSRTFDGYIADLARADVDGDGSSEILFVVNRFAGPLLGDRGKLVVWRLPAPPAGKN